MKILYFIIPLFMVTACNSTKNSVNTSETTMNELNKSKSGCPEDGTCEVLLLKNMDLKIVDSGDNKIYSQIIDGDNIVIEYTYLKEAPEGIADGNYFETIQFEIPKDTKNLAKENNALADVKMIFGKHGYRNAAYYPVSNGKLSLQKTNKGISFTLNFKINETSHVISNIKETVALD